MDIPVHAGQDIRGAVETGQKAGTCREQSGICAVGATQSEIDEQAVGGDQAHAGGFGGNQCLELQQIDDARFHQLCFA